MANTMTQPALIDKTFNSNGLENLSELEIFSSIRLLLAVIFFIVFQTAIILHKPFIHTDFIFPFYFIMGAIFFLKIVNFFSQSTLNLKTYIIDLVLIYTLFNFHPQYSSAYLIFITLNLFLAGLHLSVEKSWRLFFIASLFLSIINLKSFKWTGTQNFLTLALFNMTYAASVFIAVYFKSEVVILKNRIQKSDLKLKTQLDLSRILLEQVPVGIVAMNSQAEVIFKNNTLSNKLKINQDFLKEILGSKSYAVQEKKSYFNSELNERRYYELDHASYFDQEVNDDIDLHLIKDITDQVNLQDQLRQKEKLAAVGQLAAGIAPEIRNTLAGISGSIQLLSQDKNDPDEQKLMKIILKEIDRLNHLITEFLDYSKPDQSPDQIVDLSFILQDVIQNVKLGSYFLPNMKIVSDLGQAQVYGFSDKLKQAFLNICVNALQAMSKTENATLSIKIETILNKKMVSLKDNGSGMSPEVKQRIFEPFYTTKSKGTGLGMAITHKIFESHKAEIQIISEVGTGTEFKIFFNTIN